jgi:hypothetical protein
MKLKSVIAIFHRLLKVNGRYLLCLAGVCSLMITAGCATPGERLEPGTVDFIQPGSTTRDAVIKVFGEPTQILKSGDRTLMCWQLIYWAAPNQYPGSGTLGPSEDSTARGLSVLCDGNGVVLAKHYSAHTFRTLFGAGAVFVGGPIDESSFNRIKPDLTTQTQVLAMLGEPMMESLSLNGALVLDWAYVQGDYIAGQTQLRTLRVFVNSTGIVTAVRKIDGP